MISNKRDKRKSYLIVCVILLLGILFLYKYLDFLRDNINALFQRMGISFEFSTAFSLVLPVGISFYTLQAIGYVIDVYRGEVEVEKNFVKYMLFVSFFPQLVAGPIERSKNLLGQLEKPYIFDYESVRKGLLLMLWGFFEKIWIADTAALYVNKVYPNYYEFSPGTVVVATVLFAIQIYCDFGGYSHIAIGAAQVLGIKLMANFEQPYFATSIKEFWRRWHISLSTWLRDYLYIPLGGSRCGKWKTCRNLLITFLVSGLWHGANWTYIVWGGLHGVYQIIGRVISPLREAIYMKMHIKEEKFVIRAIKVLITFVLCNIAFIFFRADSVEYACAIIRYICSRELLRQVLLVETYMTGLAIQQFIRLAVGIMALILVDILHEKGVSIREWFVRRNIFLRWGFYLAALISFCVVLIQNYGAPASEFIYFQF